MGVTGLAPSRFDWSRSDGKLPPGATPLPDWTGTPDPTGTVPLPPTVDTNPYADDPEFQALLPLIAAREKMQQEDAAATARTLQNREAAVARTNALNEAKRRAGVPSPSTIHSGLF